MPTVWDKEATVNSLLQLGQLMFGIFLFSHHMNKNVLFTVPDLSLEEEE